MALLTSISHPFLASLEVRTLLGTGPERKDHLCSIVEDNPVNLLFYFWRDKIEPR